VDKLDFLEIKFNSVVVEIEIFEVADSSFGMDLFFYVLLNRGNMREPEMIRTAE
jgi:hypothetical protein